MSDPIIAVSNLSKRYSLRAAGLRYSTLRETLTSLFRSGSKGGGSEDFWALRDVSFEVTAGETVGFIGRNGAGKSTLLKVLSRITEPTEGRVVLRGRVASLLEVGTGFHPELTGRENIFLNGAILGMPQHEVRKKFDEIVEFAEVERFLDTPVKRYSSGMYVRLAFAVAAHLEPEVLVVDEVLAVGDAKFQQKCLGKMGAVAKSGRTVLFVSHNMGMVQQLCGRAVLLEEGSVAFNGSSSEAVQRYLSSSSASGGWKRSAKSSSPISLTSASLQVEVVDDGTVLHFSGTVSSTVSDTVSVDLRVFDSVGTPVGFAAIGSFNHHHEIPVEPGATLVHSRHDISRLAAGAYIVSVDVAEPMVGYHDRAEQILRFETHPKALAGCYRHMEQAWGFGSVELPYVGHSTTREADAQLES